MIRHAKEEDLTKIMAIYNHAILHSTATFDTEVKDYQDRKKWFDEHTEKYIILVYEECVKEERQILGYASLSRYRERKAFDATVEISIYVDQESRGKRVGTQLLKATIAHAYEDPSIETIVSLITGDNKVSARLHENLGFEYCGTLRHVGKKFGKRLDLLIYELEVGGVTNVSS